MDGGDTSSAEPEAQVGGGDAGNSETNTEPDTSTDEPGSETLTSATDEVTGDETIPDGGAEPEPDVPVSDFMETVSTLEDTVLEVFFADYEIPPLPLDLNLVTVEPEHGTLALIAGGASYTPDPDFFGQDALQYTLPDGTTVTVVIDVEPVNDPPVAADDAFDVDGALAFASTGSVLDNDTDVDSDDLEASVVTEPTQGTLVLAADGTFSYEYTGTELTDSFSYEVCDGEGDCDEATVALTITVEGDVNTPPLAEDDEYDVQRGTTLTIEAAGILLNDSDPDGDVLIAAVEDEPQGGTVTVAEDGGFVYVHGGGAGATDSFTYTACDPEFACATATVELNILDGAVNNPPLAANDEEYTVPEGQLLIGTSVLANDSDPEGGTLVANLLTTPLHGSLALADDGTFTYIHDGSETTVDSFNYEACDEGGECDDAIAQIIILPLNDVPEALDDEVEVEEGGEVSANVLTNDTDIDGEALSATLLNEPSNGTVVLNADGTFTYTHDGSETTEDSFNYQACDTSAGCSDATVLITVVSGNDPPVAEDDVYSGLNGQQVTQGSDPLIINDVDPELGSLTVTTTPVTAPTNGSVVLNADGTFVYTTVFSEPDSFVYEVCDEEGGCDTATVTINYFSTLPIAVDDVSAVSEGGTVVISVLANDSASGGSPISLSDISAPPSVGSAVVAGNTVVYSLPCADSEATQDIFRYRVCSAQGACVTAQVTVNLTFVDLVFDDLVGHRLVTDVVPALPNTVDENSFTGEDDSVFTINSDGTFNFLPPVDFRSDAILVDYSVAGSGHEGCIETDEITFNMGPNVVWHIDPNQQSFIPQQVGQAGVVPPSAPVPGDGREKFPDSEQPATVSADSYAFPASSALAMASANLVPGDIVVVYAPAPTASSSGPSEPPLPPPPTGPVGGPVQGAAAGFFPVQGAVAPPPVFAAGIVPPPPPVANAAVVQPAGVPPLQTHFNLFGNVQLPEGVALIGEGAPLPAALSDLTEFPSITFPDPLFAHSGRPALAGFPPVTVVANGDPADGLVTPLAGLDLQSFGGSPALTRSGSFGTTGDPQLNEVRADRMFLLAQCGGECGPDDGISMWNLDTLTLKDAEVLFARFGLHLNSVTTVDVQGETGVDDASVGVMIDTPGKRAAVSPQGAVPGAGDITFEGDAFFVGSSSSGIVVDGYEGDVTFNNDVEIGMTESTAVVSWFAADVTFNGLLTVMDATLSEPGQCEGPICCQEFAACASNSGSFSLLGGGSISSAVSGVGATHGTELQVVDFDLDVGAVGDGPTPYGVRSYNVDEVFVDGNTLLGEMFEGIVVEVGETPFQQCSDCVAGQGPTAPVFGLPELTEAVITANIVDGDANVITNSIRAWRGETGFICVDSRDNQLISGDGSDIDYSNETDVSKFTDFTVVGTADGNDEDDFLDNVSAANNAANATADNEGTLSYVASGQCFSDLSFTLTVDGESPVENCDGGYPLSATLTASSGTQFDVSLDVDWSVVGNDPDASIIGNTFFPGDGSPAPRIVTVQAVYEDGTISETDTFDISVQQECGGGG